MKPTSVKPRWKIARLKCRANDWLRQMRKKKSPVSEQSSWWDFLFYWPLKMNSWLEEFIKGRYVFSPMASYTISGEKIVMWEYRDRLMLSLLLQIIRPLFAHIISKVCFHMKGPAGVKAAIGQVIKAMETRQFRYMIRADISSYYASIDHVILEKQLFDEIGDMRLRNYLHQIITVSVEKNGAIELPKKGIPIRSSLSPFFGAMYLSPLDRASSGRKGICYVRFMDDILILAETKRQFVTAKKRMKKILKALKLTFSRKKTRMGEIKSGFHFLGVKFDATQTASEKSQAMVSKIEIHPRSCRRALDKVRSKKEGSAPADEIQRYLVRWSAWWAQTVRQLFVFDLIKAFIAFCTSHEPALRWLGSGLLLGATYSA